MEERCGSTSTPSGTLDNHRGFNAKDRRECGRADRHRRHQGLARHRGQTGQAARGADEEVHSVGIDRRTDPAVPTRYSEQYDTLQIILGSAGDTSNSRRGERFQSSTR